MTTEDACLVAAFSGKVWATLARRVWVPSFPEPDGPCCGGLSAGKEVLDAEVELAVLADDGRRGADVFGDVFAAVFAAAFDARAECFLGVPLEGEGGVAFRGGGVDDEQVLLRVDEGGERDDAGFGGDGAGDFGVPEIEAEVATGEFGFGGKCEVADGKA